jgi:Fic family protein
MSGASSFADLDAAIRAESKALAATRTTAAYRRESEAIAFEEIHASCRQAGALLDEHALRALIERGVALGDRPLREYLIASGYADAARFVQTAEAPRPNQPLLSQEEIVELHARATRLLPKARPGAWRVTTSGALHSGMVPPPFWLVPREIAAFVDRFGRVPPEPDSPLLFVAEAHERFTRIHPFTAGNGRAARLVTNLLLRRLGYPPLLIGDTERRRYRAALAKADARDPWPLAMFLARSILAGLTRLAAASGSREALRPLAEFARASGREALYKAAQRNRLRIVRKGRTLLTTAEWVNAYLTGAERPRPKL